MSTGNITGKLVRRLVGPSKVSKHRVSQAALCRCMYIMPLIIIRLLKYKSIYYYSLKKLPKVKDKYRYVLYEGNNLVFCGSVGKNEDSLIVEKIHEI
mgnify:CR=1 FL=1